MGGVLKNNIRAEQMKGDDGELGQQVPDLDVILEFCRKNLSGDKARARREFKLDSHGVKYEVTADRQMRRHYHKVTQADINAEDAPECTEDTSAPLKMHHFVPDHAGSGRHRDLLCAWV